MKYTVYARNNWSVAWTKIEQASVDWNGSIEQLADSCTINVQMTSAALSETNTSNLFRMFSEIKVEETDHNADTFIRFHGFVVKITPGITELTLSIVDFLGVLAYVRCDVPATSADTIRMGTDASPVALVKEVEDGEDRYIPDPATYTDAYIGGVPAVPPANRRTIKVIAGIRDSDANDTDPEAPLYFPDKILPPSLWTMGTELMNYIQFVGYTPLGDITADILVVYVEGTNQIEDVLLGAMGVALPDGPELVAGVHYNAVSADYFVRTIWPSLITINEWKWKAQDGTLADMIDKLYSAYAPPNYRPWWDHSLMMLRSQYVEQLPFDTSTSYYTQGSYPYGRIVTAPPDAEVAGDYIDMSEVDPGRTIARDTQLFKSKITVHGTNEWPKNILDDATITSLIAQWPADWTEDGDIASMLDRDFGTYWRIWWDHSYSPPKVDTDNYHPLLHIALAEETAIDTLRFWMMDSRRDFPWTLRIEAHNDPTYPAYDPDAPWEPMHPDLWDRPAQPFEQVDGSGNFLKSICQYILISMKPAKINLRFRWAAGFSEMEFVKSADVSGTASVLGAAPGGSWVLYSGAGTGAWYQLKGTGENDGQLGVVLPSLYAQLNSRAAIANKLVVGHQADVKQNKSLANTNACAIEAARILMETLRDARRFDFVGLSTEAVQKYRTVDVQDDLFGVDRYAFIQSLSSEQPGTVNVSATAFGYSNASRAGAWTGEEPDAL